MSEYDTIYDFVPILERILLTFPDGNPVTFTKIYAALTKDEEYKKEYKKYHYSHFCKAAVTHWLEKNYTTTRVGPLRKDGKVSFCAPRGIIINHQKHL